QLRQAQKMEAIGTLAGGIAHDFNNILTAILGYTELTLRNMPEESEAYQNLQEVLAAGKRAKELVQQILTFSRQHEQRYQPVQLRQVVQEVLRLVRATLPSTIEIRQYLDTPGTVLADPGQIHQVLLNLCSNAEYAMRERGGILEVRLEKTQITPEFAAAHPPLHPGPYLQLSICDTGCGMEPAILDRIFDPFFTTKGVGEGTGMGLAIVHGIVTSHGGAITVESLPGQGTTFTLYFPQIDDVLDSMGDNEPALPRGKETILLVEDEPALAALGEQMLTMLGYRVIAYTDSLKALEAFRADPQRFDLVLTDQTMPNMTGEALSRELLRIRPDLPIILYTGFSHTMTPEKARALGIRAYLMKPLVWRDLALTIRQVLEA
ncbi:MAG: response regulator, partial [Nitrospinota bacterium]